MTRRIFTAKQMKKEDERAAREFLISREKFLSNLNVAIDPKTEKDVWSEKYYEELNLRIEKQLNKRPNPFEGVYNYNKDI